MNAYSLVLFFHILAMVGLMIATAFQWSMLHSAISTEDGNEMLRSVKATATLPLIVFPSLFTVLGTGIYMAARMNVFGSGWINASLLAIFLIAGVSIMAGPATRALQRDARRGNIEQLRGALRRPWLGIPLRLQLSLLITILFLMVVRTNLAISLQIVGLGIASALLWSVYALRTDRF